MEDIKRVLFEGCEKCIENATSLKKDGKILFRRRRYESAVVVLTVALEEIGKSNLLAKLFKEEAELTASYVKKIYNHKPRLEEFLDGISNGKITEVLAQNGVDKESFSRTLQLFKNACLYTDFYEETLSFRSPRDNRDINNLRDGIKIIIWILNIILKQYKCDLKNFKTKNKALFD